MRGVMLRAAISAMLSMASVSGPALAYKQPVMQVPAAKPGKRGLFNDMVLPKSTSRWGTKGAGISMAQQKRASTKRRNVARNRAAHRG